MDSQMQKSHSNDINLEGNLNEMEGRTNTEAGNLRVNFNNETNMIKGEENIMPSVNSLNSEKKSSFENFTLLNISK